MLSFVVPWLPILPLWFETCVAVPLCKMTTILNRGNQINDESIKIKWKWEWVLEKVG